MAVWQQFDLNDNYEVSDDGRVRRITTGHIIAQWETHNGYLCVRLSANGVARNWRVNRLVLMTFTGLDPDPHKAQVAHLNGDRQDNRLDNLAWKDARGNYLDRVEHRTQVCISTHNQKLSDDDVATLRNFYRNGQTAKQLAERFKISAAHVYRLCRGARAKGL